MNKKDVLLFMSPIGFLNFTSLSGEIFVLLMIRNERSIIWKSSSYYLVEDAHLFGFRLGFMEKDAKILGSLDKYHQISLFLGPNKGDII